MSLQARLLAYLIALHLALASLLAVLVWNRREWLIPAEAALVVSLAIGVILSRRVFAARRFPDEAARLLEDGDFTSRLREVGEPVFDRLVHVYNRMADRLRGERVRLQEQHYFLGQLLSSSPSGVVVLDYDGRIASINPAAARLLGREGPDLQGRSIGELDGPLAQALAGLTAGGTSVVLVGGGRRVRCARGTFVDTGFPRTFYVLEELTEELRRAERAAYEKLIRVVSHEVNNTVGATGSLLDSCRRYARQVGEADRTDFEGAIGVAIARGEQLNRFVRAFADVVRLPNPRRDPCEVGAILDDVARLLAPECERRGIRWERRIEKPVVVPLDRAQMEQALLNVCRNAIEAVDRDGTVTVRLGRIDGRDTLAIEDTGPGIPDDARSHLFTPFFTTKPHGQGIGLTLVHEILTRHGLEHDLSADPGGPTRFTIRFS